MSCCTTESPITATGGSASVAPSGAGASPTACSTPRSAPCSIAAWRTCTHPTPTPAPKAPARPTSAAPTPSATSADATSAATPALAPATTADVVVDLSVLARHRFADVLDPADRWPEPWNRSAIDGRPLSVADAERLLCDSPFGRIVLDELGDGSILEGCIKGIEENWFQGRIADSAYELERKLNAGERIVVGVTRFTEGNEEDQMELLEITNEDEARQLKRLDVVRHQRSQPAVDDVLARLAAEAADPEINLMPTLIEAANAYASLGEVMNTMAGVFGRHVEVPTI